eukprot:2266214-Rhodomonas_salina.1
MERSHRRVRIGHLLAALVSFFVCFQHGNSFQFTLSRTSARTFCSTSSCRSLGGQRQVGRWSMKSLGAGSFHEQGRCRKINQGGWQLAAAPSVSSSDEQEETLLLDRLQLSGETRERLGNLE